MAGKAQLNKTKQELKRKSRDCCHVKKSSSNKSLAKNKKIKIDWVA